MLDLLGVLYNGEVDPHLADVDKLHRGELRLELEIHLEGQQLHTDAAAGDTIVAEDLDHLVAPLGEAGELAVVLDIRADLDTVVIAAGGMADDRILTLGDHGQIFRLIEGAIALDIEVGSIADRLSFQQKDGVKAVFLHCLLDLFLFRLV